MASLPMVPAACTLDHSGLRSQLARYRAVGHGAIILHRSLERLVVRVGDAVTRDQIAELVAVEQECCPSFTLKWNAGERVLAISVSRHDQAPALDAIAYALGLDRA